ncbi:MAG: helicase HerA-like domain-containing protein, partial [Lachnospiraceae bacterium]
MYLKNENLAWIATAGEKPLYLYPKMASRHGLIAGATGTGKTVTIKVMAEAFSNMGTAVFMADVKGDVSGMIVPGDKEGISKFLDKCLVPKDSFECTAFPTRFFDVYGEKGMNVRASVSSFGPELIARLLELTDVQREVLNIAFRIADEKGWLLIDLKDLKSMLTYVSDNAKKIRSTYGNVSPQTVGAIQRALLRLSDAGGDIFFGEPELDIYDWLATNESGQGFINILECAKLVSSPLLYSTFLLFMLSEIYEKLPEAGDLEKPKMVFFFDEAHLLFEDAPKALVQKVEQVVRLIRSKGVGVYFISQKPSDIPEDVLAQLGNKIQHALRAYTPLELKAVKAAAQSFRANPSFDTFEVITQLGTGQALVSFLDEEGIPQIVEHARILPPQSSMNMAEEYLIKNNMIACPLYSKYAVSVDRESAYEILNDTPDTLSDNTSENAEREDNTWDCVCGKKGNKGNFCTECGAKRPPANTANNVNNVKVLTYEQLEAEKQKAVNEALKEQEKALKEQAKKEAAMKKEAEKILTKTVNSATNTIGR